MKKSSSGVSLLLFVVVGCSGELVGAGMESGRLDADVKGDRDADADVPGPSDAGGSDAVATNPCTTSGTVPTPETSGFPNTSPTFQRVIDADQTGGLVSPSKYYAYAYGPSILREGTRTHVYACTPGIVGESWDHIRYTYSDDDGATWSTPTVVLASTSYAVTGKDYSACDPSIVFQDGYYYLFYSGAENIGGPISNGSDPSETIQTVIRVARATTPAGPFAKFTNRHTWEVGASDPLTLVESKTFTKGRYGVGQQSVVRMGGNLYMWYLDDTAADGVFKIKLRIAPAPWEFGHEYLEFDTNNGLAGLEVRYDPRSKLFISLGVPTYMNIAAIILSTSPDGIEWTKYPAEIVSSPDMRHHARIEGGFTGDAAGHLLDGPTLFGFAAPHVGPGGSVPTDPEIEATLAKGPYWDLFSLRTDDLSERLFRVCP